MSKTLKQLDTILKEFEKDYWVAPNSLKGQTRHITVHMTKLLGKLGGIIEKWEHGFDEEAEVHEIKDGIVPDLLIYALMLSRLHGFDLEQAFLDRLEANKKKVAKWKDKGQIKELPQL